MNSIVVKGDIKEVCAFLRAKAEQYKGMTVDTFIRLMRSEQAEREQFGSEV